MPHSVPHPHISKSEWQKARWCCAATGAWGVFTGYPLFVLLSEKQEGPAVAHFLGVLVAAVFVVAVTEWLRDTIRGESHRTHRTLSAVLSSVLLLAVFEVFVLASEEVSQASFENPHVLTELVARVSGQQTPYAFLHATDIRDPKGLWQRLNEGLKSEEATTNPEAWIVNHFLPETKWTFFPHDVAVPAEHRARVQELFHSYDYERYVADEEALWRKVTVLQSANFEAPFSFRDLEKSGDQFADKSGSELSEKELKALLAVELNKQLLSEDFYNPNAFSTVEAPPDIKQMLQGQRENRAQVAELRSQLFGCPGRLGCGSSSRTLLQLETTGNGPKAKKLLRVDSALLSFRRVVYLNRLLLQAAFPGKIEPTKQSVDQLTTNLLAATLLWVVAGGALGWSLAYVIRDTYRQNRSSLGRSVVRGALAALVIVPSAVLTYVLLYRIGGAVHDLWRFRHQLSSIRKIVLNPWEAGFLSEDMQAGYLVRPAWRLELFVHHRLWTMLAAIAFCGAWLAVLHVTRRRWHVRRIHLVTIAIAAPLAIILTALLFDWNLVFIYVLVALVWLLPAVFLGISTPYLRTGSTLPRTWGIIAIGSGAVLVLLTLLRLIWPSVPLWLSVPGGLMMFTGFLMHRGNKVEDYWPFAALVLALVVYGTTLLAQRATFYGVFATIHDLAAADYYGAPSLWKIEKRSEQKAGSEAPGLSEIECSPFYSQPEQNAASDSSPFYNAYEWQPVFSAQGGALGGLGGSFGRSSSLTGDLGIDRIVYMTERSETLRKDEHRDVARLLELSIVGSLAFWLTVGILAAWAIVVRQPHKAHGKDSG